MTIDLLLPTRGRPEKLNRLFESIVKTTTHIDRINVYVYIDDDDKVTLDALDKIKSDLPTLKINEIIGPRITISKAWNKCWEAGSGEIVMLCADDIVFETKEWEIWILNTFHSSQDMIQMVFCHDGYWPHEKFFGTHPFLSRLSTKILGKFCPPYFKCDYNDLWFDVVYRKLFRKIYLPHVLIKHCHHTANKEPKDNTEIEMRAHRDEATKLWDSTEEERELDIKKLCKYIIDTRKKTYA